MAIGTEEFYGSGGSIERPTAQFRGSEDAYKDAIAQGQLYQQRGQQIMEKMGAEKARGIRDYYAPIVETIKGIIPAYYQGRKMSDEAAIDRTRVNAEEARAQYAPQRAQSEAQQMEANVASTKAGTQATEASIDATKASTERMRALQPLEVKQYEQNLGMTALNKQQLMGAIKSQNLQNESMEDQKKITDISAIIAAKRMPAGQDPIKAAQLEQEAVADLKARGMYPENMINKGLALSRTEALSSNLVQRNILNSDPKYAEAQQVEKKIQQTVDVVANLAQAVKAVEKDTSIIDSPQFKQSIEDIKRDLTAIGQTELAANIEQSLGENLMKTGTLQTKGARARAGLEHLIQKVDAQIALQSQNAQINPHVNVQQLQVLRNNLMKAVSTDQSDLLRRVGRTQGFGNNQTVAAPAGGLDVGTGALPPQLPPINLREGVGIKNVQPNPKVAK